MKRYKKVKLLNHFLLALLALLVIFMIVLLTPAWKRIFSEKGIYNKGAVMEKILPVVGVFSPTTNTQKSMISEKISATIKSLTDG